MARLPLPIADLLRMLGWWREAGLPIEAVRALPDFTREELAAMARLPVRDLFLAAAFLHLAPRWESGELREFANRTGLATLAGDSFDVDDLASRVAARLGWRADAARAAVASWADALAEMGALSRHGGRYAATGRSPPALGARERAFFEREFAGEAAFYRACLEALPEALAGRPRIDFSPAYEGLWAGVLGGPSARFVRELSLRFVAWNGKRVLDVGAGRGDGTEQILRTHPDASVVALDVTTAHRDVIEARVAALEKETGRGYDLAIAPPDAWALGPYRGFGAPLPFDDGSFDGVLVALTDPFVPPEVAPFAYRDLARVLRPGGEVLLASAPRPERPRRFAQRDEVAAHLLFHELCERAVRGFHGLRAHDELLELCSKAGFAPERHFEGMVWVLRKPP
ncbi:MAG TPA: class I SAM-dependent methyltransferase [Candidatus Thermoplasmatota archaeon]|nr:class I SAM-dependent methyltransferase [Candidatus Thermoplasmatota archaeon]